MHVFALPCVCRADHTQRNAVSNTIHNRHSHPPHTYPFFRHHHNGHCTQHGHNTQHLTPPQPAKVCVATGTPIARPTSPARRPSVCPLPPPACLHTPGFRAAIGDLVISSICCRRVDSGRPFVKGADRRPILLSHRSLGKCGTQHDHNNTDATGMPHAHHTLAKPAATSW